MQGGYRGPDVGSFAVVKELDFIQDSDRLNPVRLAPVFAQTIQDGAQRTTRCRTQGQRGQRIAGIVATTYAQGISGHKALNMQFFLIVLAFFARFIGLQGANQPDHAIDFFEAKIARPLGHVATKSDVLSLDRPLQLHAHGRRQHGHDSGIIPVQNHQALGSKDAGLRLCISLHRAVPVQMVLRHIEHHSGGGLKADIVVELKA